MAEPFKWIKFLKAPFDIMYWVKSGSLGLGFVAMLLVGFGTYKTYFKKPPETQVIHVTPTAGSVVHVGEKSNASKLDSSLTKTLFVEGTVGSSDSDEDELKFGIRVGIDF